MLTGVSRALAVGVPVADAAALPSTLLVAIAGGSLFHPTELRENILSASLIPPFRRVAVPPLMLVAVEPVVEALM